MPYRELATVLNWVVGKGLAEKMALEQRLEGCGRGSHTFPQVS